MSKSLNRVTLLGHCGNAPEVRTIANGSKVANFSLATSSQWKDANGEKQTATQWHRCSAFDGKFYKLADIVERYVAKGSQLYVEGEIEYRDWTDKEGQKRTSTEIKVRELILLGGKGDGERGAAPVKSAAKVAENFDDFADDEDLDGMPF